ncbi:hypothetical protein DTO207G8_9020 [Paecilomyces variotii]|nr:hypothetical protein DTO169E5_92 [Paecilomyces variotii]KAJ9246366.1 hypothetical protein DTO207G8_9020 [Paecilomyces variotii]
MFGKPSVPVRSSAVLYLSFISLSLCPTAGRRAAVLACLLFALCSLSDAGRRIVCVNTDSHPPSPVQPALARSSLARRKSS